MTTLVPASPEEQYDGNGGEEENQAPRADCIADSAGGLTFDLTDPGRKGATHLLLQRREHGLPGDEVRLPLTPSGENRLRAALPSGVELAEGRWDAFVQVAGEEPERLAPGVNDLRSLVDRVPSGARGHVAVRIPYATKHGNLTVRSWWRAPHAESGELLITGARLTVRGRVIGTALTADARAELAERHAAETVLRAEATAEGDEFTFDVAYDDLAAVAEYGVWDLWLLPAGEGGPRVRIARLLDDVADKKGIFTYPTVELTGRYGSSEVGPYYTTSNDLAVRVTAVG